MAEAFALRFAWLVARQLPHGQRVAHSSCPGPGGPARRVAAVGDVSRQSVSAESNLHNPNGHFKQKNRAGGAIWGSFRVVRVFGGL